MVDTVKNIMKDMDIMEVITKITITSKPININ